MEKKWVSSSAKVVGACMGAALLMASAGVASANHRSSTSIDISNSASITNVSTAVANTGGNSVRKWGAVLTGDAEAFTSTINIVNTTYLRLWR